MFVPVELASPDSGSGRDGAAISVHDRHVEIGLRNGRSLRVGFDVSDSVVFRMIRLAEVFIETVPNCDSPRAVLLRESYRDEDGRT